MGAAGGPDPSIAGSGNALIWLEVVVQTAVSVAGDDFSRTVGRPVVDNKHL